MLQTHYVEEVTDARRWESSDTVAVDTNWFSSDIAPLSSSKPVKHTLSIMVPTSTVVEVDLKFNSITKTATLNDGSALTADAWHQFDLILISGMTYNIQHKTGTQNVLCYIVESDNIDI